MSGDKFARRVTPRLPPGETHVVAFAATEGPAARLAIRYRVVGVTDQAIHVYTARLWRTCDPGRLLSTHPLGSIVMRKKKPLTLADEILIGERRLWVSRAWKGELQTAVSA